MKVQFYQNDTTSFLNDAFDILLENEAQNSIFISNAQRGKEKDRDTSNWFCATVKNDGGGVIASAMCTPPFNIIIYETGNKHNGETIDFLAKELFNAGYLLPGVLSEKTTAESFAESYAKFAQKNTRVHMDLNAMRLDNLAEVDFASGYLREITEEDLYYLPYWANAFQIECKLGIGEIMEQYERCKSVISQNKSFVWVDKTPASMAEQTRQMPNGAVISRVYTPPFYRNKNYCTSCVWHLSKLLLDKGNKFVSLYADAGYPVSNKVYQKIGFRNVCLYREIRFE